MMGLALPVVAVVVVQCLFHVMKWLHDTRQGCASSVVLLGTRGQTAETLNL